MGKFIKINKLFLEYLFYFLLAAFSAFLFYLSKGVYGLEHFLSAWQTFLGYTPFVDFFEHHGPLQYYLFAPLFYFGTRLFFIWPIIINSLIFVFFLRYIISCFSFKTRERILLAVVLDWAWLVLAGYSFMPEAYLSFFIILSYLYFLKIGRAARYRSVYVAIIGMSLGAILLIKTLYIGYLYII
jgi:hypothetical protein